MLWVCSQFSSPLTPTLLEEYILVAVRASQTFHPSWGRGSMMFLCFFVLYLKILHFVPQHTHI